MPGELVELSKQECLALLAAVPVGRVIYTDRALPAAQPVNYLLDGEEIIFRTANGSKLAAATRHAVVGFQVDEIDPRTRTGWSVLGVGRRTRSCTPEGWPSWPGCCPIRGSTTTTPTRSPSACRSSAGAAWSGPRRSTMACARALGGRRQAGADRLRCRSTWEWDRPADSVARGRRAATANVPPRRSARRCRFAGPLPSGGPRASPSSSTVRMARSGLAPGLTQSRDQIVGDVGGQGVEHAREPGGLRVWRPRVIAECSAERRHRPPVRSFSRNDARLASEEAIPASWFAWSIPGGTSVAVTVTSVRRRRRRGARSSSWCLRTTGRRPRTPPAAPRARWHQVGEPDIDDIRRI